MDQGPYGSLYENNQRLINLVHLSLEGEIHVSDLKFSRNSQPLE
jgi:hypothetical protein